MRVLVTHAEGVLGFHAARRLLSDGHDVFAQVEPDSPRERSRVDVLSGTGGLHLRDEPAEWSVDALERIRPEVVVHFLVSRGWKGQREDVADTAAHSLYLIPTLLSAAQRAGVRHVVLESGADVYGAGDKLPFGVEQPLDRPLSVKGATLRARELLAQAFAHSYGLPVTALRFFTVYGPWGDPAVPPLSFLCAMRSGRAVELVEGGQRRRDFVYVDDAVEVISRAVDRPPESLAGLPRFAVHNVGTGNPTSMLRALELCEEVVGRVAERVDVPAPPPEQLHTWADVRELQQAYGYRPGTPLPQGLAHTAAWIADPDAEAWR